MRVLDGLVKPFNGTGMVIRVVSGHPKIEEHEGMSGSILEVKFQEE
jgi:hypothetical protein